MGAGISNSTSSLMRQEKESISPERLDRAGRLITKASVLSEQQANEIAESPFLFARIRERIASEQSSPASRGIWPGFWSISRKALPAMVIVAALSFGLSIYVAGNKNQAAAFSVDAYLGTNESGFENMVFAERRPLTRDEVLATIISRDEREAGR